MTRSVQVLSTLAIIILTAIVGHAQVCSTPVAQIITPASGSVLQPDVNGLITLTWCDAAADYFVIVETIPGAHDISYGFTAGGVSGTGQNFLILHNGCNPAAPINCVPPFGEHIYFTLETIKAKKIIGSNQYGFTAPGGTGQAATTTSVGAATATSSSADQNVTLTATIQAASTVNQGAVTFQLLNGSTNVGVPVTSAPITNGATSVAYLVPAGTAAGSYNIQASYSGGTNFLTSSGSGTLTLSAPPPSPAATVAAADPQSVNFNAAAQTVSLAAHVCPAASPACTTSAVNEGTISFQLMNGTNPLGTPVSSATVINGSASVVYALPAGLLANTYPIQVSYSGGSNFAASAGSGTLTVNAAPPATQNATATTVSNNTGIFSKTAQHITLTASVSALDALGQPINVNEGTLVFQVMDGATAVGTAVPSATLVNGTASVSYSLPGSTAAKTYTVQVSYAGGPNFLTSTGTGTLIIGKTASTTQFTSAAPATLHLNNTYTPTATSTGDGSLTFAASGACSVAAGVVTITASTGTCTVTASESAGTNFLGSSATQTIAVQPDFAMTFSVPSITIASGATGTATLNITGQPGYGGTVTFSCSGLPAKSTCSFSPASIVGSGSTTLTIASTGPQTAALHNGSSLKWTAASGFVFAGLLLAGVPGQRRRNVAKLMAILTMAMLITLVGCGGGSSTPQKVTIPGTPSGTFTVTVSATDGALTHNTSFTLTVQ